MLVWYARVSTEEQHEDRQIAAAQALGAEKIFLDKMSGKNADRPALKGMMAFVRQGDTVVIESISRLARNTKDLLGIVEELNRKGVEFKSEKEDIDTTTPTGKFILCVFGALAELERESILQRQREGIQIAKSKGIYKGRKPKSIDWTKFYALVSECKSGVRTAVSIQEEFGITPTTYYRWIKQRRL